MLVKCTVKLVMISWLYIDILRIQKAPPGGVGGASQPRDLKASLYNLKAKQ